MLTSLRLLERLLVVLLVAASLLGCDPALPTASGTITLNANVDPSEFASLQIVYMEKRLYESDGSEDALPLEASLIVPLDEIAFPYDYQLSGGVGVAEERAHVLVAWLAHEDGALKSDSPQALVEVHARDCGAVCGIGRDCYCGNTSGVNVEIRIHE